MKYEMQRITLFSTVLTLFLMSQNLKSMELPKPARQKPVPQTYSPSATSVIPQLEYKATNKRLFISFANWKNELTNVKKNRDIELPRNISIAQIDPVEFEEKNKIITKKTIGTLYSDERGLQLNEPQLSFDKYKGNLVVYLQFISIFNPNTLLLKLIFNPKDNIIVAELHHNIDQQVKRAPTIIPLKLGHDKYIAQLALELTIQDKNLDKPFAYLNFKGSINPIVSPKELKKAPSPKSESPKRNPSFFRTLRRETTSLLKGEEDLQKETLEEKK